jgi:hypothetical protein
MNGRPMMTLDQIRKAGMRALARELGPVGMVRFLQQFETGDGDYTTERHQWLDDADAGEWVKRIRDEKRASGDNEK